MTITGGWAKALIAIAILSFGLNLFLVGFMVAGHGHGFFGSRHGWRGDHMWGRSSELHQMFRDEMAAHGFDRDKMRDEMRKSREQVAEILKADTVDRAALEAALAPMVEQLRLAIDSAHDAVLDLAMKMPPDQRREMAEQLLRHHGPGFGRGPYD